MSDIIKLLDAAERGINLAKEHEDEIREFFGTEVQVDRGEGHEPSATYMEKDDGMTFIVDTGDDTIQTLDEVEVKQTSEQITIGVKGIDFTYGVSDVDNITDTDVTVNNGIIQMEVTEE